MPTKALVSFEPSQYPVLSGEVAISDFLAAMEANTAGQQVGAFDLTQIRFPSGGSLSFQIRDAFAGDDEAREIEGVILHQKMSRSYWKNRIDDGAPSGPPDCQSDDLVTGYGDPGGSCRQCPFAEFGSAAKGSGQACSQRRILFILRQGEMLPSALFVPPSSLKVVSGFMLGLTSRGIRHSGVVVTLSLSKAQSGGGVTFSRLTMKASARLDPEHAASLADYAAQLRPFLDAVKMDDGVETRPRQTVDLAAEPAGEDVAAAGEKAA